MGKRSTGTPGRSLPVGRRGDTDEQVSSPRRVAEATHATLDTRFITEPPNLSRTRMNSRTPDATCPGFSFVV